MITRDLLGWDDLHIGLAWGPGDLLDRRVTGVTSTDLQDPARYLQPGELVLSGLVWWEPDDAEAALRFATSLRSARVAALLAGESTHGPVGRSLVDACRTHRIPLLSVPAGTSFRAVTDRVYLRLWGGLRLGADGAGAAGLPASVRAELLELLHADARPADLLRRAVEQLGLPDCSIVSAAGRTVASSTGTGRRPATAARAVAVGPPGESPFDAWLLQPWAPCAHPEMLRGLADLLAPLAVRAHTARTERRTAAVRLLDLLDTSAPVDLSDALTRCALPTRQALTAVAARIDGSPQAPDGWAAAALTEALCTLDAPFAAAPDGDGCAKALVAAPAEQVTGALRRVRAQLQARLGERQSLAVGVGPAVAPEPARLRSSLVQADYARRAADASAQPVRSATEVDSLAALLDGVPTAVRAAFQHRLLAPLTAHDRDNGVSLTDTLQVFLAHDGSWARTAKALHIHVNTVHYRVQRIEELTGRNLSRLADRLDLRAALLCADAPR
ncbi:PucR family transcriptional regulator [Streptacidiphilus rugosus]|uniref:PucR family transcriptional regulator n=1 Tax=Streptacidiphilus rugosus TaxID=405783 RepID=UPI000563B3BC|nr:PucR family transcriptional regulator [Streptacidiphilus rugosus]